MQPMSQSDLAASESVAYGSVLASIDTAELQRRALETTDSRNRAATFHTVFLPGLIALLASFATFFTFGLFGDMDKTYSKIAVTIVNAATVLVVPLGLYVKVLSTQKKELSDELSRRRRAEPSQ